MQFRNRRVLPSARPAVVNQRRLVRTAALKIVVSKSFALRRNARARQNDND